MRELENISISYEIIVADGGSNDGTLEYLKSLNQIRLISGGLDNLCTAYHRLFISSSGEYILFMTDKILIRINVISEACALMDVDPMLGLMTYKFSVFKHREPYKITDNHCNGELAFSDHCLFRRRDAMKYWNTNHNKGGCLYEFCLRIFFSGKIIAYSKDITAYEIKFRHYDPLHVMYGWKKVLEIGDRDKVRKDYASVINIIETDMSEKHLRKVRVLIFCKLVEVYRKVINLKISVYFHKLMKRMSPNLTFISEYPDIPTNEKPPELAPMLPNIYPEDSASLAKTFLTPYRIHSRQNYDDVNRYLEQIHTQLKAISKEEHWKDYLEDQSIDRRIDLPYVKEILDWLIQGTYYYNLRSYEHSKYFFPIQQLPPNLVRRIRIEMEKRT
jgi:glycosyltransferase involved in cell wall biosynthesis